MSTFPTEPPNLVRTEVICFRLFTLVESQQVAIATVNSGDGK